MKMAPRSKMRSIPSALVMTALLGTAMAASALNIPDNITPDSPEWKTYFAVDPVPTPVAEKPQVDLSGGVSLKTTFYGSVAGFKAGKLFVDATLAPNGYEMAYHLRQAGISKWFSEAQNDSLARGLVVEGTLKPLYYQVDEFEKDDDYRKLELYRESPDGRLKLWSEPAYETIQPVPPELAMDTVDPLSALALLGFKALPAGVEPCDRVVKIYDGNRRFNFVLEPAGYFEFTSKGKGRYRGGAWRCSIRHERVAGYGGKEAKKSKGKDYVFLGLVPEAVRTDSLTYFPVLLQGRRGLITARLEAKRTVFTAPDGTQYAW